MLFGICFITNKSNKLELDCGKDCGYQKCTPRTFNAHMVTGTFLDLKHVNSNARLGAPITINQHKFNRIGVHNHNPRENKRQNITSYELRGNILLITLCVKISHKMTLWSLMPVFKRKYFASYTLPLTCSTCRFKNIFLHKKNMRLLITKLVWKKLKCTRYRLLVMSFLLLNNNKNIFFMKITCHLLFKKSHHFCA